MIKMRIDKLVDQFEIGLFLWQIFIVVIIIALIYLLYKVLKKVSKW